MTKLLNHLSVIISGINIFSYYNPICKLFIKKTNKNDIPLNPLKNPTMITRGIKEKLKQQLFHQINQKIRSLEVRIFTNAQVTSKTNEVFLNVTNDNFDALSALELVNKQRNEVNNIIHICNQHIIKLRLIKKLLNTENVFCVFKSLADDRYQQVSLKQLNELLGNNKVNCEKERPEVLQRTIVSDW